MPTTLRKLAQGALLLALLAGPANAARTNKGLQALYDFSAASGTTIKDRSGVAPALDLRIADANKVRRNNGSLEVVGPTLIVSEKPAAKISDTVKRSGALTLEAWIRPAKKNQSGPARIVTLSKGPSERNITLGQDAGDKYDVRLRTNKTSTNGIPSLSTPNKSLKTRPTHVVYTRDRSGRTTIYLDGKKVTGKKIPGTPSNWNGGYKLALANEHSNDRPWLGTYFLVAIYNRGLSPQEVIANFKAGAGAATSPAVVEQDPSAQLFEAEIAPIIAENCLECHDSATRKGKLDLSRKAAAFAGGREGTPIIPGKSADSLLWESVASDEMPDERPPLSKEQKEAVRKWIDSGAKWTTEVIDPADYVHHTTSAAQNWVRRLTVPEYIETVRAATGVDIAAEARKILPPDLRADGFSNTAYNLNIDLKHVDAYAQLAAIVVSRMDVLAFSDRFGKTRSLEDKPIRGLVENMGKWMLRGPLAGYEVDAFRGISTTVASAGGDFKEAIGYIIQAMLQSPRFIYQIENQRGDGTPMPLGEYELASRISYIIWGAPPDAKLIKATESGELFDADKLGAQLERMLDDPRAVRRSTQFLSEWLDLDRLDNLRPDPKKFPDWDPGLATDMRNETIEFFKEVAWKQSRPLAELLNAQVTFATPGLASHYGLQPVSKTDAPARYDLSTVPARGGLLTQGSILTVGGDGASMVTRGLFVLHDLLRGVVKDPPAGTDTTPVPSKPGVTQRSVAIDRIKSKSCGGCHSKFEPFAFGLEKFDGLGAFHQSDAHGNPLREDGEILIPGTAATASYNTSGELMDLLAGSDRVAETLTWKVTQFALGRPLTAADRRALDKIHAASQNQGGTYRSLITAIVHSDLVQMAETEP